MKDIEALDTEDRLKVMARIYLLKDNPYPEGSKKLEAKTTCGETGLATTGNIPGPEEGASGACCACGKQERYIQESLKLLT